MTERPQQSSLDRICWLLVVSLSSSSESCDTSKLDIFSWYPRVTQRRRTPRPTPTLPPKIYSGVGRDQFGEVKRKSEPPTRQTYFFPVQLRYNVALLLYQFPSPLNEVRYFSQFHFIRLKHDAFLLVYAV